MVKYDCIQSLATIKLSGAQARVAGRMEKKKEKLADRRLTGQRAAFSLRSRAASIR